MLFYSHLIREREVFHREASTVRLLFSKCDVAKLERESGKSKEMASTA